MNFDKKKLASGGKKQKALAKGKVEKRPLTFSFRFFREVENFGIRGKDDRWMSGLLEQLRNLSEKDFDDLTSQLDLKKQLRFHQIDLTNGKSALVEKDFDFIPDEYKQHGEDCVYWQFEISKATGRVIGFFNEENTIFYIVFLDPNHNAQLSLYNDYKVRKIEPGISEIEDLRLQIAQKNCSGTNIKCLYDESVHLCVCRELFEKFDSLMREGTLQTKFQEFLISEL